MGVAGITKAKYTVQSGEEVTTEFSRPGLYLLDHSGSGNTVLLLLSYFVAKSANMIVSHGNTSVAFSIDLTASGYIGVNRKETNGSLYLQNNMSNAVTVKITYLSIE